MISIFEKIFTTITLNVGFAPIGILDYIKNKSVRASGRNSCDHHKNQDQNGALTYQVELGELTEERKKTIERAILDSNKYGYDLDSTRFSL